MTKVAATAEVTAAAKVATAAAARVATVEGREAANTTVVVVSPKATAVAASLAAAGRRPRLLPHHLSPCVFSLQHRQYDHSAHPHTT
jgi:hypothetical protein